VSRAPALLLLAIGLVAKARAAREKDRRVEGLMADVFGKRASPPRRRRKPPEAGLPVPAVPPRGPLPMQGGAEAPLDFRAD
jgi:hypothetical protein